MEKSKTLFFTGHRNIYKTDGSRHYEALEKVIISFIDKGYKNFISGGALGFDTMAAECIIKLKEEGADITLIFMLPCRDQDAKWSEWERKKYRKMLTQADKVIYIREDYTRTCMFERNRAMADASSACIAYCTKQTGGTAYTVSYATQKDLPVVNIALCIN